MNNASALGYDSNLIKANLPRKIEVPNKLITKLVLGEFHSGLITEDS